MLTLTFAFVHYSAYSYCSIHQLFQTKKGLQNYGRLKQLDKPTYTYTSTCSQQNLFYWQCCYYTAQLFQTKRDYKIMAD